MLRQECKAVTCFIQTLRVLAVFAAIVVCVVPAGALPQPISPAEKAAAEAASDYLARGPIAFYERLTSDAPLRLLDRNDALQEIEVRAGEPAGASWTMRTARGNGAAFEVAFPSGVDELLMLDMKQDAAGEWKIASIRTLAELPPESRTRSMSAAIAPVATTTPDVARNAKGVRVAGVAVVALLLAMLGAATRHRLRVISTLVLLLSALAFCAQIAVIINPRLLSASTLETIRAAAAPANVPFLELRPLLRFRRAMTRGDDLPVVSNLVAEAAETSKLWKAQTLVNAGGSDVTTTLLSATPLMDLLRARTAADLGRTEEAAKNYAWFRQRVNAPDAFWLEQSTGRAPRADTGPAVMFNTSRDAGTYYVQSMLDVAGGSPSAARDLFRQAWRMQPMTRPDVVRAGFFAPLLRDPMISNLVNLNAPEESRSADVELGLTPMKVPPNAKTSASGTFVRIAIGRQTLDIPGGAGIAPRDAEVVPATEWDRREDADALQDFDQLVKSHLSSPSARLRAEKTAEALAAHNRWQDVVALTESIKVDNETVPLPLLVERVRALLRLHRSDEARSLAKSPAVGRSMQQNGADAGTLVELAELLTQAGAWDDAIDAYKRVESTKKGPDIAPRVRQVDLRRSLAVSTPVATTIHFEIHAMPDVPVTVAERVGQLLEAELTRVTSHVTLPQFSRVRVNILNWDDFSIQLTGTDDILGFYDGDITIPFGGVARFREQVVAILTHEMTHAVIAQASDDNAPRWFQEGLARRMELVSRQENIFQNRTTQQVPSISVLDAELEAGADPTAVSDAYDEAATFMRFLEDRYGPPSINALIASYRSGANTDEAFASVTKKSTVDIDREFRGWGLNHSAAFIDNSPWPYAQFYSLGIDPKVSSGFHWSKKPAKKP